MDNTLTINGLIVEFHEMHDDGRIRFKLSNVWYDPWDFCIPQCNALEYVMRLHEAVGKFWSREFNKPASNSEVKRWLETSAIRFNGKALKPKDVLDFPLYSVVLFPKGNRITIL